MPSVTFTLLPAVDVADGQSVRLTRGKIDTATMHDAPLSAALAWQSDGADWIHLVDLDAAFGRGSNAALLASVIDELDAEVELAGGICDDESLRRALSTGCARVNIGTTGLEDPAWCMQAIDAHGERVAVSLDVRVVEHRDGATRYRLAARGSSRDGGDLWDAVKWLDRAGCARYIVTDVDRDGMLMGPNLDLYRAVARVTETPVIASGGISSIEDLVLLTQGAATETNVDGAIVGKALSDGRFTLPAALDALHRIDVAPG